MATFFHLLGQIVGQLLAGTEQAHVLAPIVSFSIQAAEGSTGKDGQPLKGPDKLALAVQRARATVATINMNHPGAVDTALVDSDGLGDVISRAVDTANAVDTAIQAQSHDMRPLAQTFNDPRRI